MVVYLIVEKTSGKANWCNKRRSIGMFTVEPLNRSMSGIFDHLTFPRYRRLLREDNDRVVVGAVTRLLEPVGLVVGWAEPKTGTGTVMSLFVNKVFRNSGIGSNLIRYVENNFREKGCSQSTIQISDKMQSHAPIIKILQKCGWEQPTKMYECSRYDLRLLRKEELDRYSVRGEYTVLPWHGISAQQIETVRNPQSQWYPEHASPFNERNQGLYPASSFWLQRREDIVGWCIARKTGPETICYETLFVKPELQKTGCGIPLLYEAFKSQRREGIPFGITKISYRPETINHALIRFYEKRLKPRAISVEVLFQSVKYLA